MPSLAECVAGCPAGARAAIEVHVGAAEPGDVAEAEMLRAAVAARPDAGVSCHVHVHAGRDHNLATAMRDTGELHELLQRHAAVRP